MGCFVFGTLQMAEFQIFGIYYHINSSGNADFGLFPAKIGPRMLKNVKIICYFWHNKLVK